MSTINDIRARFASMMLNEDFQSALNRIISKQDDIQSLTQDQQKLVHDRLERTADYIDNFGNIFKIKKYFVDLKGYSEADWNLIQNKLERESQDYLESFIKYFDDPPGIDYITKFTNPTNIVNTMAKEFNLPEKTLSSIFSMAGNMKSGKGVGRGELFLGLMLDKATNAFIGDVNIDGDPYEVKAIEARLNSQNGFGTGTQAILYFFKEFRKNYSDTQWKKLKMDQPNKDFIRSFNFTQVKGKKTGSKFYEVFQSCVNEGLDLDDLFELIASTLFCSREGIWTNASSSIKNGVVKAFKDNVNRDGTPKNNEMLNYALMWQNILYYQSQEYFKGIFLIHDKKNTLAYLPVSPNNDMTIWLSQNVKYKGPSWQDKPTSESWKIELK